MHICTDVSIEKNAQSEVTIKAAIPHEHVARYRAKAAEQLGREVKVPGFRSGHIPETVLVKHVGESALMQEAAEIALAEQYPLLIEAEKLSIIGRPNISITKLAPGNPIEFTVTAALLPDVSLPDYRAIAQKHNKTRTEQDVTDAEVQETLTHIRRERAKIEKIESGIAPEQAAYDAKELKEEDLPPIDDTFVQSLGYESTALFTDKLRENIKTEKDNREREKARIAMIEELIKETPITLPPVLIDAELGIMESQFAHDVAHQGLSLDEFLAQSKKTRDDLYKEWREPAEKRAKMHLIIREISEKENIKPDRAQVAEEVEHILSHTKDADPLNVEAYVTQSMRSEMVFRFLEEQK